MDDQAETVECEWTAEDQAELVKQLKDDLAKQLKDKRFQDVRWDLVNVQVAYLRTEIIEWCEKPVE
jgi:hypothetical protein